MNIETTYCDNCEEKLITRTSPLACQNNTSAPLKVDVINHEILIQHGGINYTVCPKCTQKAKDMLRAAGARVQKAAAYGGPSEPYTGSWIQVEDEVFELDGHIPAILCGK